MNNVLLEREIKKQGYIRVHFNLHCTCSLLTLPRVHENNVVLHFHLKLLNGKTRGNHHINMLNPIVVPQCDS